MLDWPDAEPFPIPMQPGDIVCQFAEGEGARQVVGRIIAAEAAITGSTDRPVAFAVHDASTGASCSMNGDREFLAASTIKVATVAARLWQATTRGPAVTEEEWALAEAAITYSDNDSQQWLWEIIGGANGVAEFFAAAGMSHTVPSYADEDWGLTAITANDQLTLVRHLVDGDLLNRTDSDYLLDLMRRVEPEQVWGLDAGAPSGAVVALKNGWLDDPVDPETGLVTWTSHSMGYVWSPQAAYSMVVLSTGHLSEEDGRAVVTMVAGLLAEALLG